MSANHGNPCKEQKVVLPILPQVKPDNEDDTFEEQNKVERNLPQVMPDAKTIRLEN